MHGVTATREYDVPARAADIANQTAPALGLDLAVAPEDVVNFAGFVGPRYGRAEPRGQRGGAAVRAPRRHSCSIRSTRGNARRP